MADVLSLFLAVFAAFALAIGYVKILFWFIGRPESPTSNSIEEVEEILIILILTIILVILECWMIAYALSFLGIGS